MLREVDISTSIPTGFSLNTFRTGGSMNFAAVHPYCQGFEGCYTETAPNNSVTPEKCAEAGADRPVWYGRYNMGPRLTRGGLSTGWATITDGHLLKLKGTRIDKHETTVNMPCIEAGAATLVRFTAWIKCVKGAVQFSVDYPFWDNPSGLLEGERKNGLCRAQDCVGSPQGKASYWRLRSDHSQKKLKVGSKNFFEIVAFINIILIDRVFWSLGRMVAFFLRKNFTLAQFNTWERFDLNCFKFSLRTELRYALDLFPRYYFPAFAKVRYKVHNSCMLICLILS